MGVNYNPRIVNNNLSFYLDAGNTKSYPGTGSTWYEMINDYDATITNGNFNTGGYFSYDGTDRSSTGNLPAMTLGSSGSIEAVVRLGDTNATLKNIWCQGLTGVSFSFGMTVGGTTFNFRNSATNPTFPSPTTLTTGQWYHLAVCTSATETAGYVNGVSQGTVSAVMSTNTRTSYTIGKRPGGTSEYMNGDIALIRVYLNKTLSQDEVLQNYNAIRGRFGI